MKSEPGSYGPDDPGAIGGGPDRYGDLIRAAQRYVARVRPLIGWASPETISRFRALEEALEAFENVKRL